MLLKAGILLPQIMNIVIGTVDNRIIRQALVEVRESTGKTITIGSGKPGSLTKRLMAAYKKLVEKETG